MNTNGKNYHAIIEAGDFYDNLEILEASQRLMNNGYKEQAMKNIHQLHHHILQSQEIKSVKHLLPKIEAIESAERKGVLLLWEFEARRQLDGIQCNGCWHQLITRLANYRKTSIMLLITRVKHWVRD